MGRAPSLTENWPASILETICAASPRGAGTSSAAATQRMATFGSFMSSRALVLHLPLGRRRRLCGGGPNGGFANSGLQRSTRIQPLRDIRLNIVPQATVRGFVGPVFPELGNGGGRFFT